MQEIYSVKLPGNPKLGEGKPENQNHAIIFTRGNAIQTIDMNQVATTLLGFTLFLHKLDVVKGMGMYHPSKSLFWILILFVDCRHA